MQGDPDYLDGAGINIGIDSPNWVVIDNNVIDHNSTYAIHGLAARTAGIGAFDHNCLITNNTISWNTCTSEGTTNAIAGACAAYSPMLYEYTVKMQNNLFSHNLVQNNSTIVSTWAVWACGGFQNVTGIFTGNVVEYNESFAASENHFAGGGVMEFINPGPGSIVQGNTFRENITNSEGGALKFDLFQPEADRLPIPVENNYFYFNNAYNGGALHTWNVPVALVNNVFNGNYADVHGGAVFLRKTYFFNIHHIATLVNNSFYGNKAGTNGGGVYTVSYVKPLIINSIFWNDSSSVQQGNEIFLSSTGDTVEIANTDVDFGKLHGNVVDGGSNINVDPQFEDLLTLLINNDSPCFNTGTSSFTCLCGQVNPAPAYDITGMPRPQYGNFDLGAWEGLYVGIGGDPINNSGLRINNKPNPFTGSTTLTYGLSEPGTVTLRIDNGYGQTVSVLVNGYQQKGEHQVTWNAENLPSGIYYYRIEAGGKTAGGVMVKR